MGIDIDGKFLVGLWYEDFPEELKEKFESDELDIDEYLFGELDFSSASPFYDSHYRECFYGVRIQDNESVDVVCAQLMTASKIFHDKVGLQPVVYAGCHVW